MKLKLRYLNGALKGRESDFTKLPVVLGADPLDDIFFDGFFHRTVSKSHAQIVAQGPGLMIADRTDGKTTYINGRAIPEGSAAVIQTGDEIMLGENGPSVLVVAIEGATAGVQQLETLAMPITPPAPPARPAPPPAREPVTLKLEFTDGVRAGQHREFQAGPLTFGRKPECSWVFDRTDEDAAVSGRHAEVLWDGAAWVVNDLNSTNGTYLNGVRVTRAALKTGDTLQLTPKGARIRVQAGAAPAPVAAAASASAAASPEGGRTVMLGKVSGDLAPPALHFEILSGDRKGEKPTFTQPQVTLGRAPDNDVSVQDAQGGVSGHHATIRFTEGTWLLADAGSTNGTFVDGKKISGGHPLKSGEVIRLSAWGPELKLTIGAAVSETSGKVGQKTMAMAIQKAVVDVKRDEDRKRNSALADMEEKQASHRKGLWTLLLLVVAGAGAGGWFLFQRMQAEKAAAAVREKAMGEQMAQMKTQNDQMVAKLEEYAKKDAENSARIGDLLKQVEAGGAQSGAAYNTLLSDVAGLKAQNDALRGQLKDQLANAQHQRASMRGGSSDDAARQAQLDKMIAMYNQRMADLDAKSRTLDQRMATAGSSGAASAGGGMTKAQIYNMNFKAIALIRHKYSIGSDIFVAEGTGWCARSNGLIITNRHVAMPWSEENQAGRTVELTIFFAGSREGYDATVVRDHSNKEVDLALIRINGGSGFPAVAGIEQSDDALNVGDEAYIIGYPLGFSGTYNEGVATPTFTAGSISKKTSARIQYDATTYPGSSGSPVFDNRGKVAAIHFSGQQSAGQKAQGINYGVPVDYVHELLR